MADKPSPLEFSLRRVAVPLAVVFAVAILYVNRSIISNHLPAPIEHMMGRKTVDDRLGEFGSRARNRIAPYFRAAAVQYPPHHVVLLALKKDRIMEVFASGDGPMKHVCSYRILAASGGLGPKLTEGDGQVPEGIYPIESLNPNSSFHVSLRVGYPNEFDLEHAAHDGRKNLGGDIMIHGAAISAGCLAMGDQTAEDLFTLAADTGPDNVKVVIAPVDFRRCEDVVPSTGSPTWTTDLYARIRQAMKPLPFRNS